MTLSAALRHHETKQRQWTPETLIAFENDIAAIFAQGKIPYPVHLAGGNETQIIQAFADIKPEDYVLAGWRAHWHCLLKGVPPDELKAEILKGHSVSLCFPRHKVLCSGIVGGIAPIAVGIAWALKQKNDHDPVGNLTMVHVFLGDMSAESGIVHEAMKYATGHNLPIRWIIEDNGVSVCTDTRAVWGTGYKSNVQYYTYKLTRAHVGVNKWVRF
jgi:pyruvate dehydrogenase E1 component alpha subunit